ncbi:DMT family transporter [Candidatus Woesearchaeota archaeon]|nr:DMT family transporter [Candidatus Woesearchaeota archaeon]
METWLLFAIAAYTTLAVSVSIDKYVLNEHYYPLIITFVNMLFDAIILFFIGTFVFAMSLPSLAELPVLLLLAFFYTVMLVLYYEGMGKGDVTRVYPYGRALSIFALFFLSLFFFGEQASAWQYVGIFLLLIGVFLIISKRFELPKLDKAFILISGATVFGIVYSLLAKHFLVEISPVMIAFTTYLFGTVMLFIYLLARKSVWYDAERTLELPGASHVALSAIFGSVGFLLFMLALELGEGSKVYPLAALQTLLVVLAGWLFLKEKPTTWRVAGVVAILLGIILVAW